MGILTPSQAQKAQAPSTDEATAPTSADRSQLDKSDVTFVKDDPEQDLIQGQLNDPNVSKLYHYV